FPCNLVDAAIKVTDLRQLKMDGGQKVLLCSHVVFFDKRGDVFHPETHHEAIGTCSSPPYTIIHNFVFFCLKLEKSPKRNVVNVSAGNSRLIFAFLFRDVALKFPRVKVENKGTSKCIRKSNHATDAG